VLNMARVNQPLNAVPGKLLMSRSASAFFPRYRANSSRHFAFDARDLAMSAAEMRLASILTAG
jgi:hypothetical protein